MRRLFVSPVAGHGEPSRARSTAALAAAVAVLSLAIGAAAPGSGARALRQDFLPLPTAASAYFKFQHRGWTCVSTRWLVMCSRTTADGREIERLRQPAACYLWFERGFDVDNLARTRISVC